MNGRKQNSLAREIGKKAAFERPEQEVYLSLLHTADKLAGEFARLFREHGLTDPQYNVLRILRGHGTQVATRRIVEEMVTREPDITRLIDRLEESGLVVREGCKKDRRIVWVTITAKGSEILGKLDRPVLELHRRQLGHLGPKKLQALSRLLDDARRGPSTEN